MYRARADAVQGRYVLSGGRRLICIGNAVVSPGDLIWTDGRCVYGHHRTGGEPFIPMISSSFGGIPIFMEYGDRQYYADGKLNPLEDGDGIEHWGFVNNAEQYKILDDTNLFDAELDADGNLYTAERGYVDYNFLIEDFESMPTRVLRNGEVIANIDFMPFLQSALADAAADAEANAPPIPETYDGTTYSTEMEISYAETHAHSAKVDVNGHYCYAVIVRGEMTRTTWGHHDGYDIWTARANFVEARRTRLYLMTDEGDICLAEHRHQRIWTRQDGEYPHNESQEKFVEDYSVRVPIHDGYYYTFGGELDNLLYPVFHKFSGKIYAPDGTLICTGPFHPVNSNLSIARLGGDAYLINEWRIGLFVSKGGELEQVAARCRNFRLRPMNDIRKWKGE